MLPFFYFQEKKEHRMKDRGMNILNDVVKSVSEEQLALLLDSYVVVTEKLDVARVTFQMTENGVNIWRKGDKTPMSIVDRTLMQYYESAIDHITKISEIVNVPNDAVFGCYYFTESALRLGKYSRRPKNNLVLTDVRIVGEDGIYRVHDDPRSLRTWAEELRIEPMPVIFHGRLTDRQKEKIISISRMGKKDMEEATGGSFSTYLIKLLNPWAGSTFLRPEGSYDCDAIVFRFKGGDGRTVSAKVMDSAFDARSEINSDRPENRVPSDLYSIAMMDICAFVTERGISKYELKERTTDFRYLEFICLLFNDFVASNAERYRGVDFSEPEFMKPEEFRMNIELISNERTRELIRSDRAYEQLFKILLAGLRKKRRREYGLFTQRMIAEINMIIDAIREKVQPPITEGLMDFSTFRVFRDELAPAIEYEYDGHDFVAPLRCKIFVTRGSFYTKEMDKLLRDDCNGQRVLCLFCHTDSSALKLPEELVDAQAESAITTLPKGITVSVARTKERLQEIIADERESFDVLSIMCDSSDVTWAAAEFPWARIEDIGHKNCDDRCESYIMSDDFSGFKELCPPCTSKLFLDMKSAFVTKEDVSAGANDAIVEDEIKPLCAHQN